MAVKKKQTAKKTPAAKKKTVKKTSAAKKTVSEKKNISAGFHSAESENPIVAFQEEMLNSTTEKPDETVAHNGKIEVCPEKLTYANIMEKGVQFSVIFLAGALLLYMAGILPSATPPDQIPRYWNLRADEYLAATGAPKGWEWVYRIAYADNLIMLGIVAMALLSMFGYLILANAYFRKKWTIFFTIVVTEIAVILFAATGIISGGGH